MNISAEDCNNLVNGERRKMKAKFVNNQLANIEKKILMATMSGYDFVWYRVQGHFKYDTDDICYKIIRVLEKKKFYVRFFEGGLIQIIW